MAEHGASHGRAFISKVVSNSLVMHRISQAQDTKPDSQYVSRESSFKLLKAPISVLVPDNQTVFWHAPHHDPLFSATNDDRQGFEATLWGRKRGADHPSDVVNGVFKVHNGPALQRPYYSRRYQPNKSSTKSHNMPRNGDGSGDNGPVEGNDVIHGNSGDVRPSIHSPKNHINIPQTTLQHVKNNIAPMPEIEKGEGNSNQSRSNERNAKQTKPSRA
jgi:hypothetical protein